MTLSLIGSALIIPGTYLLLDLAGLGPIGAAYASVGSSALILGLTLGLLWRGRAGVRIGGGSWRVDLARQRALLDIALPSMGESFLFSIGLIALGGLVIRLGTESFAAHQLAIQLETLSFLPCIGFAGAAAALVGQSLGMRDPERATRAGWAAARMAILWTSTMGVIFVLLPAQSLGIFTSDQTVIAAGIGAVIVAGLGQPAQALIFALGGALRGAGDTRFTLAATIVNWFVVRFPLAVLLGVILGYGLTGVWVAIMIDYGVRAGLMAARFRSGRWQRLRV
jgi:putative MATE family efflux protein